MISSGGPLSFIRGKYKGPRLAEWLLALGSTLMLAGNFQVQLRSEGVQTATRYYFANAGVGSLHALGNAMAVLILVSVLAWLIWPQHKLIAQYGIALACVVDIPAIWLEIVMALKTQPGNVFLLLDLPYRPIHNFGLAGATGMLLYLISQLQIGKTPKSDALWKLAAGIGLAFLQTTIYQLLVQRIQKV